MEAQESLIPARMRRLCRIDDIADPGAKGFPPAPGGFTGLLLALHLAGVYSSVQRHAQAV